MATMTTEQIDAVWAEFMTHDEVGDLPGTLKGDIRSAVVESDAWVDTNTSGHDAALTGNFATNATAAQKLLLRKLVVAKRQEEGVV